MENEFLILLQAKLDEAKSKQNINEDIDLLQLQINKLKIQTELDPKTIEHITNQLERILNQKINITNIGIDSSAGVEAGKDFGKNFNQGASQEIRNNSSILNSFKKSLQNIGMGSKEINAVASRINNLGVQIETLNQAKSSGKKNILSVNIAGIDQYGQAIKLTQQYNSATGELINTINNVSTVQQKAGAATDTFIEKQQKAVASAENSLSSIESKLNDPNITKSLAGTNFDTNGLTIQLERAKTAIANLGNANKNTFTQAQIDVDKEITALNNLISTLKNAEYAATSLRTKDITTIKIDEQNKLEAFVQKMEQSGHFTDSLKIKVSELKTDLSNIFDSSSLTNYLNGISNLQSEFQKVDAIAKTTEKSTKLKTNIDSEKKILQIYTNELKEAGVLTGDVKNKIQEMFHVLSKVNSQNGLTTWKAELRGVKAETDAVLKSATQLSQKKINEIRLSMDNGNGASEYQNRINSIIISLEKYGIETKEAQKITASLQSTFDRMKGISDQELISQADKFEQEFKAVKASVEQAKNAYDKFMQPVSNEKATSLINRINNFLTKNTKITGEAKIALQGYIDELNKGVNLNRWNEINGTLKKTENSMRGLGRLGASLKDQISQATQSFAQWLSVSSGVMLLVSKIKSAITELKEVNSIMTEISKTADQLSKTDLSNVESSAYSTASRYGKKASNYLTGIQEMYRAGYENAEDLAELSTLAQAAGDMQADLANDYLIATDAAYKLKGNTEALNTVLDGQNAITNRNALSMKDLAEATKIAASQSASSGIAVDKATAAMGTMIATTRQGGDVAARAWKGILMNIQQVEGEVEDGEIIDAESLSKYEKACESLGVSLKEVKDGVISLRDPMQILKELSEAYTALDESDARRANLISAVGGKYRGNQLNALLENWSLYEKMLKDYAEGSGSALEEAMKSANNWEGSMNRLGNTFTKVVNNIVKSDAVIAGTNGLNSLLSVIDKVTSKLGSLGTIGLGAGLFTGLKNVGRDKMYSLICFLF